MTSFAARKFPAGASLRAAALQAAPKEMRYSSPGARVRFHDGIENWKQPEIDAFVYAIETGRDPRPKVTGGVWEQFNYTPRKKNADDVVRRAAA